MTENNLIVPNILQNKNILINFVPESEKQKVEEELESYKKKLKDSEIRIIFLDAELGRTLLSIKNYIDNEKILREENENLKIEIGNLKNRILKLEEREIENQKLLEISQCVYDYKDKIWTFIFQKEKTKNQRIFGKEKLKEILDGVYDVKLTKQQLEVKNKITENINNNHGGVAYFFNSLGFLTYERNCASHPKIKYDDLRDDFLNYCNKIWEDDEELNKIFTEGIFNVLQKEAYHNNLSA
jgi:hypothetical protein